MRQISTEGIEELKKMESVEPYVYTCQAGHQTIGVGHKITAHELETGLLMIDGNAVRWIDGLSTEQIDGLMRADLATAEWVVEACVKVPLTDNQFAALVSLCFNIGSEAFKNSSVVRVLNKGEYHLVPGFMKLWNKITVKEVRLDGSIENKKIVSQGLVNRREAEVKLWLKP
jgi:lysozyme